MILFCRETTVSKSLRSTASLPMMAITDSSSTRICLNHSSYTEGREVVCVCVCVEGGGGREEWVVLVCDYSYTYKPGCIFRHNYIYILHTSASRLRTHTHTQTLVYHYKEMLIVNSLSSNFLAPQCLSCENLLQLKIRTIVYLLLFRPLRTRVDGRRYETIILQRSVTSCYLRCTHARTYSDATGQLPIPSESCSSLAAMTASRFSTTHFTMRRPA